MLELNVNANVKRPYGYPQEFTFLTYECDRSINSNKVASINQMLIICKPLLLGTLYKLYICYRSKMYIQ